MITEWGLDLIGAAFPALVWTNPADIVYGISLNSDQLSASATYDSTNVPGTFTYTPASGTVLSAGLGQTLNVTFNPSDTTGFLSISTNVAINVLKAPVAISLTSSANPSISGNNVVFTASVSSTAATPSAVLTFAMGPPCWEPAVCLTGKWH